MKSTRRLQPGAIIALAVISLAMTTGVALRTPRFDPKIFCCDHFFYRSMAFNLFSETRPGLNRPPSANQLSDLEAKHVPEGGVELDLRNGLNRQPPFAYRIVTPLAARAFYSVTGDIDKAFYALSFVALWLSAFFLGVAICFTTGSLLPAVAGMLALGLNPWVDRWNLFDYMLSDPVTLMFIAVAIWALLSRRPIVFYLACLIGVFNKELMLPLVVAYPLSEFFLERRFHLAQLLAPLGILALWVGFRILLPIPSARYVPSAQFGGGHIGLPQVLSLAVMLLIPLWRGIRSPITWALLPFLAINVAAGLFVGNAQGRHIVQLLPALIPLLFLVWPPSPRGRLLVLAPVVVYALQIVYFFHRGSQPIEASWSLLLARHYLFPAPILIVLLIALVLNEVALHRLNQRKEPFRWSSNDAEGARTG